MILLWILLGLAAAAAVLAVLFWRRLGQTDELFAKDLAELGLKGFHSGLISQITRKERPISDVGLTRKMMDILLEMKAAKVPDGQAGVIEPPDESTRLACEELAKLGRLKRSEDGKTFAVVKP